MAWQYCVTPLIAQLLSQEVHESKYQSGRLPAVIRVVDNRSPTVHAYETYSLEILTKNPDIVLEFGHYLC